MERNANTLRLMVVTYAVLLSVIQGYGQGTTQWTVTFDGAPRGTTIGIARHSVQHILFRAVGQPPVFLALSGGGIQGLSENGTAYLQALLNGSLGISSSSGQPFALVSMDLAEYSTVFQTPLTVPFIGYLADGSTVAQSFTTDGIIDGTGPLADFQTFHFDARFGNVVRVEIPTYGWSLDNMVFGRAVVPEPSSWLLLALGGAALWGARSRRR